MTHTIDEDDFFPHLVFLAQRNQGRNGFKRKWIDPLYLNRDFRILIFRVSFRSSSLPTKYSPGFPKQNNLSAVTEINVLLRSLALFLYSLPANASSTPLTRLIRARQHLYIGGSDRVGGARSRTRCAF